MMMYEEEEIVQNDAWSSELPADLLGLISDKVRSLSISEYIKFGSVCVAWRSFSIENYQHIKLPSKLPMLLIPIPIPIPIPTTTTIAAANNKYIPSPLSSIFEEEASEEASSIEEEALAEALTEALSMEEEALAEALSIEEETLAEALTIEQEAAEALTIEQEAAEASEDEWEDEMEDDEMEEEEIKLDEYYNPKDIWKGQNYKQRYRSTRNFYSIYDKKVYHDFGFHVPYYKNIRGSSNGWLVTVEECYSDQGVDYYPVRLFNPFRTDNNEIQLPPLNHYRVDCKPHTSFYLHKAILSANPSSLSDDPTTELVVLGICTRSLAFCRPGDKYWTHLEMETMYRPLDDIICYQGEFYGILQSGYVFAFDTALFDPTFTATEGLLPPQEDSYYHYKGQIKRYLVESEGELLQVRREISICNQTCSYVTCQFLVFKLDPMDHTKWVEIKTLNDRILFLGNSSTSMSLSALEFPGCKPNSIYYTDDMEFFYYVEQCSGPHDIGVFNLEDGSFEPHHGLESMIMPAPIWIQPML